MYTDEQRAFLRAHRWGVLATARSDGSPQQVMVSYTLDERERVLISTQTFTAKWRNAVVSRVCLSRLPTIACTS